MNDATNKTDIAGQHAIVNMEPDIETANVQTPLDARFERLVLHNPKQFRKLRWLELALVLWVAFGVSLFTSFYYLLVKHSARIPALTPEATVSFFVFEMSGIGVLFYVLFRLVLCLVPSGEKH